MVADELRYFGPDSVTLRVLTDPAAAVGGIRALLLQALHPLAMAGYPGCLVEPFRASEPCLAAQAHQPNQRTQAVSSRTA